MSDEIANQNLDKTELWERERQKRIQRKESERQLRLEKLKKRMIYFEDE